MSEVFRNAVSEELVNSVIEIAETCDPYEARDTDLRNEYDSIFYSLEQGNVEPIIDTINSYKDDMSDLEFDQLYGDGFADKVNDTLLQLNEIKESRKEVSNGKPKRH